MVLFRVHLPEGTKTSYDPWDDPPQPPSFAGAAFWLPGMGGGTAAGVAKGSKPKSSGRKWGVGDRKQGGVPWVNNPNMGFEMI